MLAKMRKQPYNPHGGQKNDTGRPALPPLRTAAMVIRRSIFSGHYLEIKKFRYLCTHNGGLAQLARALAWHARGHQFDPGILHNPDKDGHESILIFLSDPSPVSTNIPSIILQRPGASWACTLTGRDKPAGRLCPAKNVNRPQKTQSPVIQYNDRQRTRLLKKISVLYRHYREHRF